MLGLLAFTCAAAVILAAPLVLIRARRISVPTLVFAVAMALVVGGAPLAKLHLLGVPVFVADALLLFGVGCSLFLRARSQPHHILTAVVMPFVIVQLARAIYQLSEYGAPFQDIFGHLGIVEYISFAVVGALLGPPSWSSMLRVILISGQACGLLSLYAFMSGTYSVTINGSARYLSSNQVVAASLALIVLIIVRERPPLQRACLAILPGTALLLIFQRTAWLAFFVGATVALVLLRKLSMPLAIRTRQTRFATVILLGAVILASPFGRHASIAALSQVTGVALSKDANIAFRASVQTEQLAAWRDHPVFGVGYAATVIRPSANGLPREADGHNGWVTLLWRTGALGLALAVCLFALALRRASAIKRPQSVLMASGLAVVIVGSSFNVWLEAPYLAPLAWLFVGYSLAGRKEPKVAIASSPMLESGRR